MLLEATEPEALDEPSASSLGSPVTRLLHRWAAGDSEAAEQVFSRLYEELHTIAAAYFRAEPSGHTLQPTALIHEAFLRLKQADGIAWTGRRQFLAIAARLMRQILVDHARRLGRRKRGGGLERVPLMEAGTISVETPNGLLALDEALRKLESESPEKAAVVELRFFGGLTIAETAAELAISAKTVNRQWRRARAWLFRELCPDEVRGG